MNMSTAPDRIVNRNRSDDVHNSSLGNFHFLCLLAGVHGRVLGLSTAESTLKKFGIPYKRSKMPEVKKYECV